jgi:hypothetical protein
VVSTTVFRAMVRLPRLLKKNAAGLSGPPPDDLVRSRLYRPNIQAGPRFKLPKEPEKSGCAEKQGTDHDAEDHAAVQRT